MDWTALRVSLWLGAGTSRSCCRAASGSGACWRFATFAASCWSKRWSPCRWCCRRRCSGSTCSSPSARARRSARPSRRSSGHSLPFSFEGLLLASAIANIPFVVQPIQRGFEAIPADVRDAAACCGLTPWQRFVRIEVPLAWPGILTAAILTFAHTLGEFGVVLMVGGNLPGETRTLSVAIYDRMQAFDDRSAGVMAATLLVIAVATLMATTALSRRVGPRRG